MLIPSSLKFQTFIAYYLLLLDHQITYCNQLHIINCLDLYIFYIILNYLSLFIQSCRIESAIQSNLQQSNKQIRMIQNKENDKSQSQKAQQQKKKQAQKFTCTNKRQAIYCCSQPDCDKPAIKCIGSNSCGQCKRNHLKCPREIKIENVFERADAIVKHSPLQTNAVKPEDEIQRLIRQLKAIKQKISNYNIREWGLSKMFLDLLYNMNLKDQTGNIISEFTISEPIYPDKRYYKPVQFVKDVDRVYKINQQLQKRSLILFKIYKKLAENDSALQAIERRLSGADKKKSHGKYSQYENILGKISLNELQKFHKELKSAIIERLSMNNMFAGAQVTTTEDEIKDFQDMGKRIFRLTFSVIGKLFGKSQYNDVQKFTNLNFQLFNKDRKQYGLQQNHQFATQEQKMRQNIAMLNYLKDQFKLAYSYFINLADDKYDENKLKIMIDIIENLDDSQNFTQAYLKYLLMLHEIQNKNQQLLIKIIDCYKIVGPNEKIFQFMRKLNTILKQNFKLLSTQEFIKYLQREQFCVKYLQSKKRYVDAMVLLTYAQRLISLYEHQSTQIVKIDLKWTYDHILLQRLLGGQFAEFAGKGVQKCRKYLQNNNQIWKNLAFNEKTPYKFMVQQYLVKFLTLWASTIQDKRKKLHTLKQASNYYEAVGVKFQVFYQLAKLSFELGQHDALSFQDKAIAIYPTDVCYRQKGLLHYKEYFSFLGNRDKLKLAIEAANASQLLNPRQTQLCYLKGLAHQNLMDYEQSNIQFQKAIALGSNTLQIQRRIAENNQFIAKKEVDLVKRKEILDKTQQIYRDCVEKEPTNKKSILGYGRVLKLQKKNDKAEICFEKLIDSEYKSQAYMYLGNLKEQKAIQKDDRDMDMLEQALELYKNAGKIKENKENMVRIYRQLDRQRQANKIEVENWQ